MSKTEKQSGWANARSATKPSRKQSAADRREAFIRHYLIHKNASRAYREAGYKDGSGVRQSAHNLLTSPYVQQRLAEEQDKHLRALDVEVATVFARHRDIAFADVTQITGYHIGCCRYCYGIGHAYQWRTQREYEEALHEAIRENDKTGKAARLPSNAGGTGFSPNLPPHDECPECNGRGIPEIVFKDTRFMTEAEKAVFAGVEVTKEGIKYRLNDQVASLNALGKDLGMFKTTHEVTGKDGAPTEPQTVVRIIKIPAKVPEPVTVRPMPDEDAQKPVLR